MTDTSLEINKEFVRAEQARAKNNEGQARVCARRAAGIAIRDYFNKSAMHLPNASAYDLLNRFKEQPHLPPEIKLFADHLTLRVTEEFKLPVEADLVAEAKALCLWLENQQPLIDEQ